MFKASSCSQEKRSKFQNGASKTVSRLGFCFHSLSQHMGLHIYPKEREEKKNTYSQVVFSCKQNKSAQTQFDALDGTHYGTTHQFQVHFMLLGDPQWCLDPIF